MTKPATIQGRRAANRTDAYDRATAEANKMMASIKKNMKAHKAASSGSWGGAPSPKQIAEMERAIGMLGQVCDFFMLECGDESWEGPGR